MRRKYKKFEEARTIFERMDTSKGWKQDFLRNYWIYLWLIPWSILIFLSFTKIAQDYIFYCWPILSITMMTARYFDIFFYRGTTLLGYPTNKKTFYKYIFTSLIPALIGELISYIALKG